MSKLTVLDDLPVPRAAAPHNFRVLGEKVMIANDSGDCAWLSAGEYRDYLRGKAPELALAQSPEAELNGSLLAWTGPAHHLIFLQRKGSVMPLEGVRDAIDLVFSAPGPRLNIELIGAGNWSRVWFAVQYCRRKSEWTGRAVGLVLRLEGEKLGRERSGFLRAHGAALKVSTAWNDLRPAQRAVISVPASARDGRKWAAGLEKAGYEWVRLSPQTMTEEGVRSFLRFYAGALHRMLEGGVREERAAAFLSRGRWNLPGHDVLGELAYAPGGAIYSSEEGLRLAEEGIPAFCLGSIADTRFADLSRREAVRASIAASHGDNQPLCFQCVYKPFCSLPPAQNFKRQGTIWGQTPSSLLCSLHMGILDLVFKRLNDEKCRNILRKWSLDFDPQTV